MTLVEVMIAMVFVAMLCGGLYGVGIKARQFAEHNRVAFEARSLAKERLEELIAYGLANLAKPSSTLLNCDTNLSSLEYEIVRRPRWAWHDNNGNVVGSTNAAYVEIHLDVTYQSPLLKRLMTDSYSMIIEK
jgi:hypothetical protein